MYPFTNTDEDEGAETAEQVLNKLETDTPTEVIIDEIDRALQSQYMEGVKKGRLEAEEPENETTMFRMIIGTLVLTAVNTLILAWPIIQSYT